MNATLLKLVEDGITAYMQKAQKIKVDFQSAAMLSAVSLLTIISV